MPHILLTTLNAKYAHASFGLRCLMANLGELQDRAAIAEFDVNQRPGDILERILWLDPKIVGIGVYIWNVEPVTRLVADLKRLRPGITVILGGPEVSHEIDQHPVCGMADYIVTGEADLALADLCRQLIAGSPPAGKVIAAPPPKLDELTLPYDFYDQRDVDHRVIYVEASRGCPFSCEFCLSSLEIPVRQAPLEPFLAAMGKLLDRGVRRFKFVDRTFNLNLAFSRRILDFFLERHTHGLFVHFEMIPDRLPEPLREPIRRFPPGALQFEVGIQTFNSEVAALISRKQDLRKIEENLKFLKMETGVHVHADLIAGLPGEDLASFTAGFDRLIALGPQEIQLGILKRLRGTPIVRHDQSWGMVYSPNPPYEILQTKLIDFPSIQRLKRAARYWDLVANSGNFRDTHRLIWGEESPFTRFLHFSDWLFIRTHQTHAIALNRLAELLMEYLLAESGRDRTAVIEAMTGDFRRAGRSEGPAALRELTRSAHNKSPATPPRQSRHLD